MEPAGQQQMADLAAEERHGLGRLDRDAHHRPGRAVDPARQIDRKDARRWRSWPRSWRARTPSTGRSSPAPNSASMTTSAGTSAAGAAAADGPGQRCAASGRVALEPARGRRPAAPAPGSRARPACGRRRSRRRRCCPAPRPRRRACRADAARRRFGHRPPGILHQRDAGDPPAIVRRSASAISAGGEQLDHRRSELLAQPNAVRAPGDIPVNSLRRQRGIGDIDRKIGKLLNF